MDRFPSETAERFQIRMPDGLRDGLRDAAAANNRSMNAEIVARLEAGGKTLRDEFAMTALSGMLAAGDYAFDYAAGADQAYLYADAMIAARQKGGA